MENSPSPEYSGIGFSILLHRIDLKYSAAKYIAMAGNRKTNFIPFIDSHAWPRSTLYRNKTKKSIDTIAPSK